MQAAVNGQFEPDVGKAETRMTAFNAMWCLTLLALSGCALIQRAAIIDGSGTPSVRRVQVAQRIDDPMVDWRAEQCAPEMTPECLAYVVAR